MSEEVAQRPADLRLVPAALCSWAAMGLATWGDWRLTCGAAVVALVVCVLGTVTKRWAVVLAAAVALACLAAGGAREWARAAHPVARAAEGRAVVDIDVRIAGEARPVPAKGHREALRVVPVEITATTLRGVRSIGPAQAVVLAPDQGAWRDVVVGERWRTTARLAATDRGDAAVALLKPMGQPTRLAGPGPDMALVEQLREGLRRSCAGLWPSARGLVPALVVGDVRNVAPELSDVFRTTGLTHLTAVSGSNLALLLSFVTIAASRLRVRGWWLRGLGVATALGFVLLCRAEPSVVRAAAMGLVTLAALGSGARGPRALRHLALAVVVLMLVDPWLSRSAGFALSTLATAGIVLVGTRWTQALSWLPSWLAEAIGVSLAAQVATQPLVTAISGQVTVSGLAANAVAGPLVGPATVAGVIATLLWWCPPLAVVAATVAGVFAMGVVAVARVGASVPGASWEWPATGSALVVMTLGCALVAAVMPALLRSRLAVLGATLLLVLLAARVPTQPAWPPRDWAVVQCDVGQGNATVVNAGDGSAVLVDTGPDARLLERCLAQLSVARLPLVVLTHDHADHVGGLDAALTRPVGRVLLSGIPSSNRPALLRQLAGHGVASGTVPGEVLAVGGATWRTVAAPQQLRALGAVEGESSDENDGSLVGVATSSGVSVLVSGDVEPGGQAAALSDPAAVRADVLVVPHHGSSRQDPSFLAASGAHVALIGVGLDNEYRHPAPRTVEALRLLGMTVVRTDRHGALAVAPRDGGLAVVTQKSQP